eukprot:Opistho-2@93450
MGLSDDSAFKRRTQYLAECNIVRAAAFVGTKDNNPTKETRTLLLTEEPRTAISQRPNKLSARIKRMLRITDENADLSIDLTVNRFDHLKLTMAPGADEDAVFCAWERALEIMVQYPPDVETVCAPEFPIHSLKAMPLTDAFLASAGLIHAVMPFTRSGNSGISPRASRNSSSISLGSFAIRMRPAISHFYWRKWRPSPVQRIAITRTRRKWGACWGCAWRLLYGTSQLSSQRSSCARCVCLDFFSRVTALRWLLRCLILSWTTELFV